MTKRKCIIIFLGVLLACGYSVYWGRIGGTAYISLRNTLYLATPFAAIVGGVYAISVYGIRGSRARTLMLLTIGMACWFIGEALFNYYADVAHLNPFPSIADYFYVVAYPLLFLGLFNEISQANINLARLNKGYIFLFSLVSLVLAGVVWYFGVYLAFDPQETLFTNLIAMGYGVGDLFLIVTSLLLLVLAWEFKGGKLARAWFFVFVSFIATIIADILFAMYTNQYKQEVFFYKNFLDSIWMLAYILFAYAMFDIGMITEEARRKIRLKGKKKK